MDAGLQLLEGKQQQAKHWFTKLIAIIYTYIGIEWNSVMKATINKNGGKLLEKDVFKRSAAYKHKAD